MLHIEIKNIIHMYNFFPFCYVVLSYQSQMFRSFFMLKNAFLQNLDILFMLLLASNYWVNSSLLLLMRIKFSVHILQKEEKKKLKITKSVLTFICGNEVGH